MNYTDSVCFSVGPVDELNRKAFNLDHRLFMFAYYEPKQYCEFESRRSQFMTAAVNLYGLFKDCVPLLPELLKRNDSILVDPNRDTVRDDYYWLFNAVTAFRSIICHNSSLSYPLNEDNLQRAENWIYEYLPDAPKIEDIAEPQWLLLLQELCATADSFILELSRNLDLLLISEDTLRKNRIIKRWIVTISSCYLTNPDYLLNALASMYQLYLLETGDGYDPSKTLRQQTQNWLRCHCGASGKAWFTPWLDKEPRDALSSKVYAIIDDWENQWAQWNGCNSSDCDQAPLPAGDLFCILAKDVYTYAMQPHMGYHPI